MSPTGIRFTYGLGAIFVVGGILFMFLLDDNRLLFGIPYAIIGLVLIAGARGVARRAGATAGDAVATDTDVGAHGRSSGDRV